MPKDCPNGCDQSQQKPKDDFCAKCGEKLESTKDIKDDIVPPGKGQPFKGLPYYIERDLPPFGPVNRDRNPDIDVLINDPRDVTGPTYLAISRRKRIRDPFDTPRPIGFRADWKGSTCPTTKTQPQTNPK